MRQHSWWAIPVALCLASCGPVPQPCTPESCAGGCCDEAGVCVAGKTVFACGAGGQACAVCAPGLACIDAACAAPPPDEALDAGGDAGLDGGSDAGWDGGALRTVEFNRTPEILYPDGGRTAVPNNLSGATVMLHYEQGPGGEWVTLPSPSVSTLARFDAVPSVAYTLELQRGPQRLLYVSDAASVNGGPKIAGRRSSTVASPTLVRVDAGVGMLGRQGDTMALTSFTAGVVSNAPQALSSGPGALASALDIGLGGLPFTLSAGDDLTITLNRAYTDAGATLSAAYLGGTIVSPALNTGQTASVALDLVELPRRSASLAMYGSDFAQFVADVNPGAVVGATRLQLAAGFSGASLDGGGDYDGRSAFLLSMTRLTEGDLIGDLSWGNPFGPDAVMLLRGSVSMTVQLTWQGRTLTRVVDALVINRLLDTTRELRPALSPPRFVLLNGATVFVNRNGVGLTPVFEWSAPLIGTPTQYTFSVLRVSPSGNGLIGTVLFSATTPWPRFRVPPGQLTAGEAYYATITAQRVPANDARLTPNRTARDSDEAVVVTNIFTP